MIKRAGTILKVYEDGDNDFDIKEMANLIARPLNTGKLDYRNHASASARMTSVDRNGYNEALTHIRGDDGTITF